jgi:hypothetical protein
MLLLADHIFLIISCYVRITQWGSTIVGNLMVLQLVKKYPVSYENRRLVVFNSSPLVSVLTQTNAVFTLQLYTYNTHFNTKCSYSWKYCYTCKRFIQYCVCISYLSHPCYMLNKSYISLFILPSNVQ